MSWGRWPAWNPGTARWRVGAGGFCFRFFQSSNACNVYYLCVSQSSKMISNILHRCATTNLGTSCHCEQRLGQRRACWDNFCHLNVNILTWMCSSRIYVYNCVYIYNYIYYISICIYTALCNHRRGPISQVLGVFSSHGYLRSQVHAAIENVGLKEVWLKIAGGEKAMRPRDWGNPSPLGFVVLGM
jgi:hypothetical protein